MHNVLIALTVASYGFIFAQGTNPCSAQERLQKGILSDSAQEIENAIKEGAIINFELTSKSPLLKAVLLKKENAIEALLKAGANPNIMHQGKKLVHYAIKQDALKIATLLVNSRADFSGIVDSGQDAFVYVLTHYDLPTVSGKCDGDWLYVNFDLLYALIKHGYDLRASFSNTDLERNSWYLINKLQKNYFIAFFLNQAKCYPLSHSANTNQIFVLPDGSTWTPLLITIAEALKKGSMTTGLLYSLLNSGANPNLKAKPDGKKEQSPLSYALSNEDKGDVINLLLDNKADIVEGFDMFIKNGGSPDYTIKTRWSATWTLLGIAIDKKNLKAVQLLITAGADLNKPFELYPAFRYQKADDPYYNLRGFHPPIFFAIQEYDTAIAELLLQYGAHL
jgi:ankyrin repeat protein